MIEQGIFAAIGFLSATVLAMAAAPAVSRRARRLAEARARLLAPLSEAQSIAERDALRAQHAVDLFRLERCLSAAEETAAARRIEVGRHLVRIVALEDRTAGAADEVAAAQHEANELRGELGAAQLALADLAAQLDRAGAAWAKAETRRDSVEILAEARRAEIAALETCLVALEARAAEAVRAAEAAAERAIADRARIAASLAEAESRLARSESAREEAVLENRRQLSRVAERESAASRADGDKALRAAIARLGRDVARLDARRLAIAPEPINLAPPLPPAVIIRQGEPASREG